MRIIHWNAVDEDGLTGFVGRERAFDIMPWADEAHRWPWQLHIRSDLFCQGEYVRAARTREEAQLLAEDLTRHALIALDVVPADPAIATDFLIPRSDPRRKAADEVIRSRNDWLRDTGWYDPSVGTLQPAPGRLFYALNFRRRLRQALRAHTIFSGT